MLSTWFLPAQMVFSTSLQPWATEEWPEIFATSAVLQPRVFLAFRGCLAITFLGHQLAHLGAWASNACEALGKKIQKVKQDCMRE